MPPTAKKDSVLKTRQLKANVRARKDLPSPPMRRAIRQEAGVSVRAFAKAVGVTGQAVAFWEKGERTPTGERLVRYVELLRDLEHEANR